MVHYVGGPLDRENEFFYLILHRMVQSISPGLQLISLSKMWPLSTSLRPTPGLWWTSLVGSGHVWSVVVLFGE